MNSDLNIAVAAKDAEAVAQQIGSILGFAFKGHDSGYKGSYWLYEEGESTVEVFYNHDPMFRTGDPPDDQWFKPSFKDFRVLVEVDAVPAFCSRIWAAIQTGYPGSVVIGGEAAQLFIQADAASPRRLT